MNINLILSTAVILASVGLTSSFASAQDESRQRDVVVRALVDELQRSMTMQLEGEEPPYFVEYGVDDTSSLRVSASCGGLTASDTGRNRRLTCQVRVGSYELDNTNFAGGRGGGGFGRGRTRGGPTGFGGAGTTLPLDDDYATIREAAWRATDAQYKSAVDALQQKRLYLQDRTIEERPDDFARVEPVVSLAPGEVILDADAAAAEALVRAVSACFLDYGEIQSSGVQLSASARTRYLVNSEGTLLRDGATRATLTLSASTQDPDGVSLSDQRTYQAAALSDLPSVETLVNDAKALAEGLVALRAAPILKDYAGPVLFDDIASAQLFQELFAQGVVGRPEDVGGGRRRTSRTENLESSIGKRLLPRDLQAYDDPRPSAHEGRYLSGSYLFDDEGVPAQRVDLVVDGKLEDLLMSRTPTETLSASNGHARASGRAGVGCLFVESTDGLTAEELKAKLLETAEDQNLEYAIRIRSLGGGGRGGFGGRGAMRGGTGGRGAMRGGGFQGQGGGSVLPDPVHVFKVYVSDGHEERVRGCELGDLDVRALKDIVAAGSEPMVYDQGGASIVAPPVILEEVDLYSIDQERGLLPVVAPPNARGE